MIGHNPKFYLQSIDGKKPRIKDCVWCPVRQEAVRITRFSGSLVRFYVWDEDSFYSRWNPEWKKMSEENRKTVLLFWERFPGSEKRLKQLKDE